MDLLHEPLVAHLVMAALSIWPLMRIARRVGRPAWPAWFLLIPLVGPAIAVTLLVRGPWPRFPDPPQPRHPRDPVV